MLADTLPLSPQETGPFLHIGIVGGMTLLAWPLASVIYRTRNTGNPPELPTSPCGWVPSLLHSTEQHRQQSSVQGAVGTGPQDLVW